MPHVLFVCTANICRSPVAEGILRDRLQKRGLQEWTVASAGTWALEVRGASRNSVLLMEEAGIDISNHQAKIVTPERLKQADLILTMELGHAEALQIEFPEHAHKVYLLTEMIGQRYNVEDPYRRDLSAYRRMVEEVTNLIDTGLDNILALAQENARHRQ